MTLFSNYTAEDIEVLSGLEPVKRRPGMYTDTTRPNHLAHEVVDNSVDEAIAGFADRIDVTLHPDDSIEVQDNGRGMPVDLHPEEKIPGVELIMTRLHAGAKFSNKNYQFSGGLHGVGVSVVNALSKQLEVTIKRDGKQYRIEFQGGDISRELELTGTVGKRNTGTSIRFWPDPEYFDSPRFSIPRLRHILRAKAVLCPGLQVHFSNTKEGTTESWQYAKGLQDYLLECSNGSLLLPEIPFTGSFEAADETVDWAVAWLPEEGEVVSESYVNLIPTLQGGTHVNGFRTGLLIAVREFCEFRNLIPRASNLAVKISGTSAATYCRLKCGIPVFGSDKGTSFFASVCSVCFRCCQGCFQSVAEPAHRSGRADCGTGDSKCPTQNSCRQTGDEKKNNEWPRPAG